MTATVDPATNLIIREEWPMEGVTERTVERHVIEATPDPLPHGRQEHERYCRRVPASERERLEKRPVPVYGLPAGYTDLPLTWIIPYPDGRMVI